MREVFEGQIPDRRDLHEVRTGVPRPVRYAMFEVSVGNLEHVRIIPQSSV